MQSIKDCCWIVCGACLWQGAARAWLSEAVRGACWAWLQ